jgi:hypothetical protein
MGHTIEDLNDLLSGMLFPTHAISPVAMSPLDFEPLPDAIREAPEATLSCLNGRARRILRGKGDKCEKCETRPPRN